MREWMSPHTNFVFFNNVLGFLILIRMQTNLIRKCKTKIISHFRAQKNKSPKSQGTNFFLENIPAVLKHILTQIWEKSDKKSFSIFFVIPQPYLDHKMEHFERIYGHTATVIWYCHRYNGESKSWIPRGPTEQFLRNLSFYMKNTNFDPLKYPFKRIYQKKNSRAFEWKPWVCAYKISDKFIEGFLSYSLIRLTSYGGRRTHSDDNSPLD